MFLRDPGEKNRVEPFEAGGFTLFQRWPGTSATPHSTRFEGFDEGS
jgi:hypothetical protein